MRQSLGSLLLGIVFACQSTPQPVEAVVDVPAAAVDATDTSSGSPRDSSERDDQVLLTDGANDPDAGTGPEADGSAELPDGSETAGPTDGVEDADEPGDVAVVGDVAGGGEQDGDVAGPPGPPNVLLVIADDLGVEAVGCYGVGAEPPSMPTLEALCAQGVRFEYAWSEGICSPARAGMLTGRRPSSTGIGHAVGGNVPSLDATATSLPALLVASGYEVGSIGKWHLGTDVAGDDSPAHFGWQHYSGVIGGEITSYTSWPRTTNGITTTDTRYATSAFADDAISWLVDREEPWLLWLAFVAPHPPFHLPPLGLHSYDSLEGAELPNRPVEHFRAATEALDTELGRVLASLSPEVRARTVVIFVGDNGSPGKVAEAPVVTGSAKDTLQEGGIRVPFVVAGPGVASGVVAEAPVHTRDLFATILEMAGIATPEAWPDGAKRDSASLVPLLVDPTAIIDRLAIVSELFDRPMQPEKGGRALRDARWKWIRHIDGTEKLYDLAADPWEAHDLIDAVPTDATETLEAFRAQHAADGPIPGEVAP